MINQASDGSCIKLADPAAELTEWQLNYAGLNDDEVDELQQFFTAAEGTLNGFTFLELLISLTIFSMVAAIVYATLNLGARAAERGDTRSTENQRARAALALISHHLKSAYPLALQAEGETIVYFFGEPDELSFISAAGRPETGSTARSRHRRS